MESDQCRRNVHVYDLLGVQDVVGKSIGTSNPHNMIKATFDAFSSMYSPRNVANKRGRKVSEIFGNKLNSDTTSNANAS